MVKELCLIAEETVVNDVISSLKRTYLISSNLLTEKEVFASMTVSGERIRRSVPFQILRTLSLIIITMNNNILYSSLRTNYDLRSFEGKK